MYRNLKIRTKILLGFLIVVIMMLVNSIISLLELNELSNQVNAYSEKTLPEIEAIWEIRRDLVSSQRYILRAIAETDSSDIKEATDLATEDANNIRSNLDMYTQTAAVDESLLSDFQTALDEVGKNREAIIPYLTANTDEGDAQALQIYEQKYKPAADRATELAVEIYELQLESADAQAKEAERTENGSRGLSIILMVLAAICSVVITIFTTAAITIPVREIEETVAKMSVGDFSTEITYTSKDELGQLAENCDRMERTITIIIRDLGEMLSALANGDFTRRSTYEGAYIGEFNPIIMDLYTLVNSLSTTLSQINQSADQVANGSEQVSLGAQSLSQGAVEQASSVQELSATISEISGKVKHTAENAQLAKKLSGDSAGSLEISRKKMDEMISAMNDISSSSNEINKIIKTIDDIAFQTNILSLNAAVEAARAGAAGKGFAVVADEVRTLAQKSAEAVQSTTSMIESTIQAVAHGSKIVDSTSESIMDVVESTKKVVEVIDSIAADAEEQADAISQITVGVDQISSVVQTNSATSEESAAASEELSGQADGLKNLVSVFRLNNNNR